MISIKDVREVVRDGSLYFACAKLPYTMTGDPAFQNLSEIIELFVIGPKSNYVVTKTPSGKSIGESQDSIKLILEDVLVEGTPIAIGDSSTYDCNATAVSEENGRIKIESQLQKQIDFILTNRGTDYTGRVLSGYVSEIEKGPFDF